MSKLLERKRWFSISEAAKHLTATLGEAVSEADVSRFAHENGVEIQHRAACEPAVDMPAILGAFIITSGGGLLRPHQEGRPTAQGQRFSMTRQAMVDRHQREWPSIERDLKDANTNGLALAKAGSRGWLEYQAVEWARANGKLNTVDRPAAELTSATHRMASLTGVKHMFGD